jgi:UDP-N-acetylmuramoylalanine--D-glutamate ligase
MAAKSMGVSLDDIRFVLKTFKGLDHRLELVRELDGIRYYDDSFSTVPETAIAAIQAFSNSEILILGGSSKNSDFTELGKIIAESSNIKAIIGIGIEWEKIKSKTQNTKYKIQFIEGLQTMTDIVRTAKELSAPGDVVLLSPACASFGMFKNYKDRGNQFKEQVNLL